MPLRIWLPLNNSYENRGIDGSAVTTGGVFETPGKLSAYCWRSSARISVPYTYGSNEQLSVCMWIKPNSANAWTSIFGWGNTSTRQNRIEVNANAGTTYYFFGSNDCLVNSNLIVAENFTNAVWHHFAMVADGTKVRFYLDGALAKTINQKSQVSATFDGTNTFYFGGYSDNYNGYYNDVRVYDHALSQKEVVDLAKGMLIHYTLDNPYTTGIYNFYSGTNAQGDSSSSSFTKTKLSGEDGYNYKLTRTGNGSNSWPSIGFPGINRTNFTAGKKYTWSAKVRVHTWTAGTMALRNSISGNDYTNGSVNVCSTSLADNQWHQYSRTITLTEGMKIGSTFYYLTEEAYNASTESSKAYMSPRVEFYCSNQNGDGTVYDMDFDIKEVQLIESDSFPGWVDNTMATNVVRDNTGRGNDATCSGSVTTETGSPRNTRAFKLLDTSYLQYTVPAGISQCTIAFWVKRASGGGYSTVDSLKNNPAGGMWLAVNTESCKVWSYWGGTYNKVSGTLTANTWYHVAMTFNAGISQWYVNGETAGSAVDFSAKGTTWPSGTRAIGNSYTGSTWNTKFSGSFSDWRFYTTVLTAAQIKELYNSPISVANTGACLSEQFTEGASGISFAKTGIASSKEIFSRDILVEPDGSKWIQVSHHVNPTTYKFSSSDPFSTGVWKDAYRFLDGGIMNMVDKWEFLVVQKGDATAATCRYRWSQTKNPNTAVFADVAAANITKKGTADGYTDINSAYGGIYKFNSNTFYCANNGSNGNWWGAIGAWGAHQGGIPGYNAVVVKDGGFQDLYLRIDNVTWSTTKADFSLDKDGLAILSPEFIEQ